MSSDLQEKKKLTNDYVMIYFANVDVVSVRRRDQNWGRIAPLYTGSANPPGESWERKTQNQHPPKYIDSNYFTGWANLASLDKVCLKLRQRCEIYVNVYMSIRTWRETRGKKKSCIFSSSKHNSLCYLVNTDWLSLTIARFYVVVILTTKSEK